MRDSGKGFAIYTKNEAEVSNAVKEAIVGQEEELRTFKIERRKFEKNLKAAENPKASLSDLTKLARDLTTGVRSAVAKNPNTTNSLLAKLSQDGRWHVRMCVARNPNTTPALLESLGKDEVARNPHTPTETLTLLTKDSAVLLDEKLSFVAQTAKATLVARKGFRPMISGEIDDVDRGYVVIDVTFGDVYPSRAAANREAGRGDAILIKMVGRKPVVEVLLDKRKNGARVVPATGYELLEMKSECKARLGKPLDVRVPENLKIIQDSLTNMDPAYMVSVADDFIPCRRSLAEVMASIKKKSLSFSASSYGVKKI